MIKLTKADLDKIVVKNIIEPLSDDLLFNKETEQLLNVDSRGKYALL